MAIKNKGGETYNFYLRYYIMAQKKLFVGGGIIIVVAAVALWWIFSSGPLGQPTGASAAENAVKEFGDKLQLVTIGAGSETLAETLQVHYGNLVDPALLEQWSGEPLEILGRRADSLWADRIEIDSTEQLESGVYRVLGKVMGVAPDDESAEVKGTRLIAVTVENKEGVWIITDIILGSDYE